MKFKVPDMSCGHCTSAIETSINEADPSATVTCDLSDRTVQIESKLSEAEIKSTLSEAGYESEIAA